MIISSAFAVKEAFWLGYLLKDLESWIKVEGVVTIYSDSLATMAYSKDPKYYRKTKYIGMKYNFVRYAIEEGEVKI